MASVESVQPSTSNLMNPLIPTTITAEILVENMPSQSQAGIQPSVNVASAISNSSVSPQTSNSNNNIINHNSGHVHEQNSGTSDTKNDKDGPEAKRRKVEHKTGKIVEKLEARLGGILCCAVCLDLPRTAMYQVKYPFLMFCLEFRVGPSFFPESV